MFSSRKGIKLSEEKIAIIAVDDNSCQIVFDKDHPQRCAEFFAYFKKAIGSGSVDITCYRIRSEGSLKEINEIESFNEFCTKAGWKIKPASSAHTKINQLQAIYEDVVLNHPNSSIDIYISVENKQELRKLSDYFNANGQQFPHNMRLHFVAIATQWADYSMSGMIYERYLLDRQSATAVLASHEEEKVVAPAPEITRKQSDSDKSSSCWARLCCGKKKPAAKPDAEAPHIEFQATTGLGKR